MSAFDSLPKTNKINLLRKISLVLIAWFCGYIAVRSLQQSNRGNIDQAVSRVTSSFHTVLPETKAREEFYNDGFLGPSNMFTDESIVVAWTDIHSNSKECTPITFLDDTWHKACFADNKALWGFANHHKLLSAVEPLLGDSFMLWSASVFHPGSNTSEGWHSDIETASCKRSVNVWISVKNWDTETAPLQLIKGSHHLGVPAQTLVQPTEYQVGDARQFNKLGQQLLSHVLKTEHNAAEIVKFDIKPGQGIIYHGSIWHGMLNLGDYNPSGILLQYAAPECSVMFATSYQPPFTFSSFLPPVALVKGNHSQLSVADRHRNNYFWPHQEARLHFASGFYNEGDKQAMKKISKGQENMVKDTAMITHYVHEPAFESVMFKPFAIASSKDIDSFEFHSSNQAQYQTPHSYHSHEDEEIYYVNNGTVRLELFPGGPDGVPWVVDVSTGGFLFIPRNVHHTPTAMSYPSAGYTCIRYTTKAAGNKLRESVQRTQYHEDALKSTATIRFTPHPAKRFWKSPTDGLQKLAAHVTTKSPGEGYQQHVDTSDTLLVVEEGTLLFTPGNITLTKGSQVFVPAGALHGVTNIGKTASRHFGVEFFAFGAEIDF